MWISFAEMGTRTAPREAQQGCTKVGIGSIDAGFFPTASARRAAPTTSSPAPSAIGSAVNGIPLLQEQGSTEKILAHAECHGMKHVKPQKNQGAVRAQLWRARKGVRRDHVRRL